MRTLKVLAMLALVIITSFYYFPFTFTFFPVANTKMILAALGLVFFVINLANKRESVVDRSIVILSTIAIAVSLVAFASTVINHTLDDSYSTYVMSMWVWLGGAYAVVQCIRLVHGKETLVLAGNYLITVCVCQCILALIIDSSPAFRQFVSRIVGDLGFVSMDMMAYSGRLYGIGCSLDVAGTRFASVLVILAFIVIGLHGGDKKYSICYMVAFAFIVVVGNMISRTTIVGAAFAIVIWLFSIFGKKQSSSVWRNFLIVASVAIIVSSVLYNTSPDFRSNIRFAFEGFFSIAEKGHWETNSNNMLANMVVFPETLHTWIIGDGYMLNPFWSDQNYVGDNFNGFYMQTDIGYLRFIFYFGMIGLITFSFFMVAVALSLAKKYPDYRIMFVLLLVLNFVIWLKVSTDIFVVFAVFLSLSQSDVETIVVEDEDNI